jgi:hypothetical protein
MSSYCFGVFLNEHKSIFTQELIPPALAARAKTCQLSGIVPL